MKKYMMLATVLVITILSACARRNIQSIHENTVIVYDSKDKKILETSDADVLEQFANYRGDSSDTRIATIAIGDVPKNSELAYKFLVKADKELDPLIYYSYKNNNYLKITKLPFIGKVILELSEEEMDWFRNPKNW